MLLPKIDLIACQPPIVKDSHHRGLVFMTAAEFWGQGKRAALASLISGAAELAVTLLTGYSRGMKKIINFPTHREIDLGFGAMTATMPEFLAFKDEDDRKFFLAQGAIITALNGLTRFPEKHMRAVRMQAALLGMEV